MPIISLFLPELVAYSAMSSLDSSTSCKSLLSCQLLSEAYPDHQVRIATHFLPTLYGRLPFCQALSLFLPIFFFPPSLEGQGFFVSVLLTGVLQRT